MLLLYQEGTVFPLKIKLINVSCLEFLFFSHNLWVCVLPSLIVVDFQ